MKVFIFILLFTSLHQLTSCVVQIAEYYIINKGFEPTKMDHEVISYKTFLSSGKPSEKRICGYFTMHRRIEQVGLNITMERKTKTSYIVNSGYKINIANVCNSTFPMRPFMEKFNGTFDETCALEPGVYSLWNWTLEEHMKGIIPKMLLDEYTFHLSWLENNNCVMRCDVIMDFRNLKEKEAEDKMASNNVKEWKKERKSKDKDKDMDKDTEKNKDKKRG